MKHEPPADGHPLGDYQPVRLTRRREEGWTATRQRQFLVTLAETGCISEACRDAGITARSAYRLRAHPSGAAFAAAWDRALRYATGKLMTLAYERAIRGAVREQWRDGKLVGESRQPSEKLLMFLLNKMAPWNAEPTSRWARLDTMAGAAAAELESALPVLEDRDVPADALRMIDFEAEPPHLADDRAAPFDTDDSW
jgi:hypothetical protein